MPPDERAGGRGWDRVAPREGAGARGGGQGLPRRGGEGARADRVSPDERAGWGERAGCPPSGLRLDRVGPRAEELTWPFHS